MGAHNWNRVKIKLGTLGFSLFDDSSKCGGHGRQLKCSTKIPPVHSTRLTEAESWLSLVEEQLFNRAFDYKLKLYPCTSIPAGFLFHIAIFSLSSFYIFKRSYSYITSFPRIFSMRFCQTLAPKKLVLEDFFSDVNSGTFNFYCI